MVVNQLMPPLDDDMATIPTEVNEQLKALDAEHHTHLQAYARFCDTKRKDQQRARQLIRDDTQGLSSLQQVEAPLFDLEIRGVPALRFFGDQVWTD